MASWSVITKIYPQTKNVIVIDDQYAESKTRHQDPGEGDGRVERDISSVRNATKPYLLFVECTRNYALD